MTEPISRRRNTRLPPEAYSARDNIIHFTICTRDKARLFAEQEVATDAAEGLVRLVREKDATLYCYVLMPEHLHLLVSLGQFETPGELVRYIKGNIATQLRERFGLSRIWQKGFYDHVMRTDENLAATAEYILNNPVRRGMVETWEDYPWSGTDVFELE